MTYDDFLKRVKEKKARPEGIELDGAYNCQTCQEQVGEAQWFPAQKVLTWECSQGHTSVIEGFSL